MRIYKSIIYTFLLFAASFATAAPKTALTLSDIPQEMDRILQGHVSKKQMNVDLIKGAVKTYIQQFDPYGVYLLNSEVLPYFDLSDEEALKALSEYKKGTFSLFTRCNTTIQNAITGMRSFRRGLVVNEEEFYDLAKQPIAVKIDSPTGYPETSDSALRRQAIFMANLVVKEYEAAKKINRETTFKEAVRVVELEIEEDENSYLLLDRLGKPLDKDAKEELLAFHILKALTASLDAHTRYLNPQEATELRMKLEKNYVGVGIQLQELGKAFVVSSIVKGSSADTTGVIKIGDELVSIDKTPVQRLTLARAQSLLEGEPNTSVNLEFKRRSSDGRYSIPVQISLQRREITLEEGRVDTSFENIGGGIVGIINLHAFYQGSSSVTSEKDMQKALSLLQAKGNLKGLILDLRDNKGGFLMQAVKVAGLFIKSGVVVAAKYSNGDIHYFRDLDPAVLYSGPLIVLISKETASAAEILAEALKDYGVAIVVGDAKSFGKGSIQLQTVTQGKNEESYFKVTVGRYYGVSGKSTQLEGVKSDIVVPSILSIRKFGEEYLNGALETDSIEASYQDSLSDVPQKDKKWFQKYYIPFIQPKVDTYRKWIPQLAKLSNERMSKNTNYERLLQGENSIIEKKGLTETQVSLDQEELKQTFLRYQLQETVEIMKDLIRLAGNR